MIILSIEIFDKEFGYFTDFKKITHIHSDENTQGKTTLVRFIIYGLGYNVPISDRINPIKYKVKLKIQINDSEYNIIRDKNLVTISNKVDSVTKSVAVNNNLVLEYLFRNNNYNILKNILGSHYIDQECGWSVFNRGYIIGSLRVNIDQILYGLSNVNEEVFIKSESLNKQIKKYQNVMSIFEKQDNLNSYVDQFEPVDDKIKNLEDQLINLRLERKKHVSIRNSAIDGKKHNESIWQYIDSLKIYVKEDGQEPILINHNNLYGLPVATDILDARIYEEQKKIDDVDARISKINEQLKLYYSSKDINILLKEGGAEPSYKIDLNQTKVNLHLLERQKEEIDRYVNDKILKDDYFMKISSYLNHFANELNISEILPQDGILCKEFKKKTGTEKQKLVLAYRLSILKIMSEYLGIKLPIIIDSLNRETDAKNMKCILDVIQHEFKDHQLIVSTICDIDNYDKKVEIIYPLLTIKDKLKNVKKLNDKMSIN